MARKEKEEHSSVRNKHRIVNGSQKKIVLGGPKEEEARSSSKGKKRLSESGVSHLPIRKECRQ